MKIGQLIKNYRDSNKVTMQDFADAAGISKAYISILEKGYRANGREVIPSYETMQGVAKAMKISVTSLVQLLDKDQLVLLDPTNETDSILAEEEELARRLLGNHDAKYAAFKLLQEMTEEEAETSLKILEAYTGGKK